ncbi:MAG TPA: hypothetical protein VE994_13595 [Terriglobales bacterium]|nr:hypothetical protein [Terriglobales bacterium]
MSPHKERAVKIPATSPKARDAGPRLIPQSVEPPTTATTAYHLELADIALGRKKPEPKRTRLRNSRSAI